MPLKNPFPISHEEAATLLPWYVNGTLAPGERARVQAHLDRCAACRDELGAQRALASQFAEARVPEPSSRLALARLRERLEPRAAAAPEPPAPLGKTRAAAISAWRKSRIGRRNLIPVAIAAGLMLALLPPSRQPLAPPAAPDFRTLADRPVGAAVPQGDLRLVFERGLDPARVDALLKAVGGQPIETPGGGEVFTIRLTGAGGGGPDRSAAIAYLRGREGVLFVEPIQRSESP